MVTNNDKILKVLKTKKELITTTELSNETNIDIKNITRYLKPLENEGLIVRKTIQNGKIRVVMIELSKEINKPKLIPPKPIKVQDLKPPKPAIIEKVPEEEFFIDFNRIANNSSFQRFIVEAIKMCVPQLKSVSARSPKDIMAKNFSNRITEIDKAVKVYDEIQEIGRGTHQDFREVVIELKEKLAKRKAKIEESN